MEDEEGAAEAGYFAANGVELCFFEGGPAGDEFFLFQPLFEKEFVGCALRDLVKGMRRFCAGGGGGFTRRRSYGRCCCHHRDALLLLLVEREEGRSCFSLEKWRWFVMERRE